MSRGARDEIAFHRETVYGHGYDTFPDFITFLRHHIAHNDNQRVT